MTTFQFFWLVFVYSVFVYISFMLGLWVGGTQ